MTMCKNLNLWLHLSSWLLNWRCSFISPAYYLNLHTDFNFATLSSSFAVRPRGRWTSHATKLVMLYSYSLSILSNLFCIIPQRQNLPMVFSTWYRILVFVWCIKKNCLREIQRLRTNFQFFDTREKYFPIPYSNLFLFHVCFLALSQSLYLALEFFAKYDVVHWRLLQQSQFQFQASCLPINIK